MSSKGNEGFKLDTNDIQAATNSMTELLSSFNANMSIFEESRDAIAKGMFLTGTLSTKEGDQDVHATLTKMLENCEELLDKHKQSILMLAKALERLAQKYAVQTSALSSEMSTFSTLINTAKSKTESDAAEVTKNRS